MAIPESIMQEFGIPEPGSVAVKQDTPDNAAPALDLSDTSDESLEARIQRLTAMDDDKGAQPNAQPAPASNAAQQPPNPAAAPGQQPAAATDPAKAFAEASGKAFFSDTGELNTQKINDFYLTNGKSFLKYAEQSAAVATEAQPPLQDKAAAIDPEKEYTTKVAWVAENFGVILEDQKKRGFDDATALVNIQQYLTGLISEKATRAELKKTIEEEAKRFAPEFEAARQARIESAINRNVTELSEPLKDLIPGIDGRQALNQLLLTPQYGGATLDWMFRKENPGCEKLPEKERNETARTWFNKFQQDKQAMAFVAEFGRLRWMAENFKPILEHAQKVGAAKVANAAEAGQGAPSGIVQPQKHAPGNSQMEQFFNNGMDSVN